MTGAYKGKALVAFIDLLGFSTRINETWGTDNDVLDIVLEIKNLFSKYSINPTKIGYDSDPGIFYQPEMSTISDSFVVVMPVETPLNPKPMLASLLAMYASIGQIVQFSIENGFPARGAIELGEVYWNGHDIIGPCFNKVYFLESKICSKSRILVGDTLLDYFGNNPIEETSFLNRIFYRTEDNLISLGHYVEGAIPLMQRMREAATDKLRGKYDEFINQFSNENNFPTSEELISASTQLKEEMDKKTS